MATPKAQLDAFIAKYSPDVAKLGRAAIARMRKGAARCAGVVYDNDRPVPALGEPVLRERPQISELMQQALARSSASLQAGKRGAIVIKSISARQRPRRSKPM